MATKKKLCRDGFAVMLLAMALAGCTPPGPRALLDGKKLIEQGKYEAAIERLKVATDLMDTNALAWNYLGLAYHHANHPANAVEAYQKALKRNPDLIEVHYDLGCLLLDQNRPDQLEFARNELVAFTLRRTKSAEGLLKLGTAQLRLNELGAAEKSFNEVRRLNPQNPEALNDLGMVMSRRNQPREAAAFFTAALKLQPDYAPALLNLATVTQAHLNNLPLALQKYQAYLALNPRPANWDAVNATVRELQQQLKPPAPHPTPPPAQPTNVAKAAPPTNVTPKTSVVATTKPETPPKLVVVAPPRPPVEPAPKPEVVKVQEAPVVRVADDSTPTGSNLLPGPLPTEPVVAVLPSTADSTDKPEKRGFFQKLNPMNLFHKDQKAVEIPPPLPKSPALADDSVRVSSLSTNTETLSKSIPPATAPAEPLSLSRYNYQSPPKPASGNRSESERMFTQGLQAHKDRRFKEAEGAYRAATQSDPAYFEAQANLGLAAFDAGDLPQSLLAYETALAINPISFNARFNFSLALKKAGYIQDAALELERVIVMCPVNEAPTNKAMAHLTLANLYAEQFHQPAAARPHYLKVLELDPRNSQATAIRFWLRDNS